MKFDRLTIVFIVASALFLFFVFSALLVFGLLMFSPENPPFRNFDFTAQQQTQRYFHQRPKGKRDARVQSQQRDGSQSKADAAVPEIARVLETPATEKTSKAPTPSSADTGHVASLPVTKVVVSAVPAPTVKALSPTNWKVKSVGATQLTGAIAKPITLATNIVTERVDLSTNLVAEPILHATNLIAEPILHATNLIAEPVKLVPAVKLPKMTTGYTLPEELDGPCRSTLTLDNESGENAVVKVVGPSDTVTTVPDGADRTVNVCPGHYHIKTRYGDVKKEYRYSRGEPFEVRESGTTYSRTIITLHPVVDGNYSTKPISAEEFNSN